MPLILPNDLANDILADGEKLQQNFVAVEDYVNQDTITRDGATAMTGALLLPGPPAQANQAATKAYVDSVIASAMVGEIKMYGGDAEPPNWMFCRGQAISRFTYASLFQIFGIRFGGGDGSTTFNLPDMRGQYAAGAWPGGDYLTGVGNKGGSKDAVLPAHAHDMSHNHASTQSGGHSNTHSHDLGGHSHYVSGNTTAGSANHAHSPGDGNYEGFTLWDAHGGGNFGAVGGSAGLGVYGTTSYSGADHVHGVGIQSGGPNTGSGWAQQDHSHATSTPNHSGSTTQAGVAATNANLPPSVALNYIVRVV